ncbi:hypothetical protein QBC34DRAFT_348581 [Podospora aff. communis PSN243]|uniref:Uncharacterized protein n=1 Tax=Podospora aff. communis PSN243 TaxID=3040156 RepID=A0AAV9GRX7_9PEZI|nr:hypothetical protein QBC34DRAFT_348581 [Podospora aff. communis PSN243]
MTSLTTLLTPTLLTTLTTTLLPFPQTTPLDFPTLSPTILNGPRHFPPGLKPQTWKVLITLSKLPPASIPTLLLTLLPSPQSPDFPTLALGMQLLLDQMPRRLFKGIDKRWCAGFFDGVAVGFAELLDALDGEVKPWAWERWKGRVTLGYYVVVRIWFGTPWVHCDTLAAQQRAGVYFGEVRGTVEAETGMGDAWMEKGKRGELMGDVYALRRLLDEGPPRGEGMEGFVYWVCAVMDAHRPVVERFGRYPSKNVYLGVEDTEEEREWLERVGRAGMVDGEVRERLRRDVEQGVWSELGVDSEVDAD